LTVARNPYISKSDIEMQNGLMQHNGDDQCFYGGLIRLHILHHAAQGPLFGLAVIGELARHGYKLSPGTLYPLLHGLERKGYLCSTQKRSGKTARRMYRATPLGRKVLVTAREKVSELFAELLENELKSQPHRQVAG
jgi:PadR family transcriptional regulator, regulatory protein PadR